MTGNKEVRTCAIKMAVAQVDGVEEEVLDGVGVHSPYAETDDGHVEAGVEGDRHRR